MPGRALQESDLNAKPDFRGKVDAFEGTQVLGCVSAGPIRSTGTPEDKMRFFLRRCGANICWEYYFFARIPCAGTGIGNISKMVIMLVLILRRRGNHA